MGSNVNFAASVTIGAIDKATARINALNAKFKTFGAPLMRARERFKGLGAALHLDRVAASARRVGAAFRGMASGAGVAYSRIKRLGAVMAAIGGITGYFIAKTASWADDLADLSVQLGVSVEMLQKYRYVGQLVGIEQEAMDKGLGQFVRRLAAARTGTGPMIDTLRKMAPAYVEQFRASKDSTESLQIFLQAMGSVKDPARRAALAFAGFGKAGQPFISLADMGAEKTEELIKQFEAMGGVLDKKTIVAMGEFSDTLDKLKAGLLGLGRRAIAPLIPKLQELADKFAAWLQKPGTQKALDKLAKKLADLVPTFDEIRDGLKDVGDAFKNVENKMQPFIDMVGGPMNAAMIALGGYILAPIAGSALSLLTAILSLGTSLQFAGLMGFFGAGGIKAFSAALMGLTKFLLPVGEALLFWRELKKEAANQGQDLNEVIRDMFETNDWAEKWRGSIWGALGEAFQPPKDSPFGKLINWISPGSAQGVNPGWIETDSENEPTKPRPQPTPRILPQMLADNTSARATEQRINDIYRTRKPNRVDGEIKVRFENAPAGMRVERPVVNPGGGTGIDLSTNVGSMRPQL